MGNMYTEHLVKYGRLVFTHATLYKRDTCRHHVCVSTSVCLSQVGVLLRRLNLVSRKQRYTIAHGL